MMNKWMTNGRAALLLASLVTLAVPGQAAEPDDAPPFSKSFLRREMLMLSGPPSRGSTALVGGAGEITPTGDIDFVQTTCQGNPLRAVGISGFHLNGGTPDIDIEAYDLSGALIGSSRGTGSSEEIDLAGLGHKAAFLKVYGYQGAVTRSYSVFVYC